MKKGEEKEQEKVMPVRLLIHFDEDSFSVFQMACERNHWDIRGFTKEAFAAFLLFWAETFYREERERGKKDGGIPQC